MALLQVTITRVTLSAGSERFKAVPLYPEVISRGADRLKKHQAASGMDWQVPCIKHRDVAIGKENVAIGHRHCASGFSVGSLTPS